MIKLLTMFLLVYGVGFAQVNPQLRVSNLTMSFIPVGFDSNDNSQIVVSGFFTDTCSKPGVVQFQANPVTKVIEILATEYRYAGPCLDIQVPYNHVINLGVLEQGNYRVVQKNGKMLGNLYIRPATRSTPDDYLYAPVSQAYIKNVGSQISVTLAGNFTSTCMNLNQISAQVQNNVIVIQPIASYKKEGGGCADVLIPFEKTVIINGVRSGQNLLHVRSLNGNSINNIFSVK